MCRKTAQKWTGKSRRNEKRGKKCDMFLEGKKISGGGAGGPPSNPPAGPAQCGKHYI
jgi:hypothetical protein